MASQRQEAALRKQVAKTLGKEDVDDRIWAKVKKDHFVEEALNPVYGIDAKERLVAEVRDLYELREPLKRRRPASITHTLETKRLVPEAEYQRALVFSDYLGVLAGDEPLVQNARSCLLGNKTLSPARAESFVRSPALRFLSLAGFKNEGIPILRHKSELVNFPYEPITRQAWKDDTFLRITFRGKRVELPVSWEQYQTAIDADCPKLAILPSNIEGAILPGCALQPLKRAGVRLAKSYGWSESPATWFVLTGKPPHFPAVGAQLRTFMRSRFSHFRLTLTVDPWVSQHTIAKVYKHVQRRLMDRQTRPLSLKNLRVFAFVLRQGWRPKEEGPFPWTKWMNAWNRKHRKELNQQYDRVGDFFRDFQRARKHVPHPPLRLRRGSLFGRDE